MSGQGRKKRGCAVILPESRRRHEGNRSSGKPQIREMKHSARGSLPFR